MLPRGVLRPILALLLASTPARAEPFSPWRWLDSQLALPVASTIVPPSPEVLCARLAAFRIVNTMAFGARGRECPPALLSFGRVGDGDNATSIFTTVRFPPEQPGPPMVRFKLNGLDSATLAEARALSEQAIRSVLRGYGMELPQPLVTALRDLTDGLYCLGRIRLEIATERQDERRHNIFLSIRPSERAPC